MVLLGSRSMSRTLFMSASSSVWYSHLRGSGNIISKITLIAPLVVSVTSNVLQCYRQRTITSIKSLPVTPPLPLVCWGCDKGSFGSFPQLLSCWESNLQPELMPVITAQLYSPAWQRGIWKTNIAAPDQVYAFSSVWYSKWKGAGNTFCNMTLIALW